jgi:hypothetical protein
MRHRALLLAAATAGWAAAATTAWLWVAHQINVTAGGIEPYLPPLPTKEQP